MKQSKFSGESKQKKLSLRKKQKKHRFKIVFFLVHQIFLKNISNCDEF